MTSYLHGHHEAVLRSHRSRTAGNSAAYLLPVLRPGDRVLDVGSGPGTITCDLAGLVAEVVAIEQTESALDLTRQEAARRGVTNVSCRTADVHRLPFPDDSFDVAHAHQVLQHLADPVTALCEMARVVRPGGYVAARDSDYGGFLWHPHSAVLDGWLALYLKLARRAGGEPEAGRWFPGLGGCRRAQRRSDHQQQLVLHHRRRPRLVGRSVGGPRHCVQLRAASTRGRRDDRRVERPERRLAGMGAGRHRPVPHSARGTACPGLNRPGGSECPVDPRRSRIEATITRGGHE